MQLTTPTRIVRPPFALLGRLLAGAAAAAVAVTAKVTAGASGAPMRGIPMAMCYPTRIGLPTGSGFAKVTARASTPASNAIATQANQSPNLRNSVSS
jgi:hypothetical protein